MVSCGVFSRCSLYDVVVGTSKDFFPLRFRVFSIVRGASIIRVVSLNAGASHGYVAFPQLREYAMVFHPIARRYIFVWCQARVRCVPRLLYDLRTFVWRSVFLVPFLMPYFGCVVLVFSVPRTCVSIFSMVHLLFLNDGGSD